MTSAKIAAEAGANLDPIVVLAADDNFAMPLAATVRSALENLSPERTLRLYVLDGGLSDATKERLIRSWPAGRFQIAWVDVDPSVLALAPISGPRQPGELLSDSDSLAAAHRYSANHLSRRRFNRPRRPVATLAIRHAGINFAWRSRTVPRPTLIPKRRWLTLNSADLTWVPRAPLPISASSAWTRKLRISIRESC